MHYSPPGVSGLRADNVSLTSSATERTPIFSSTREREVCGQLLEGQSTKQIAAMFELSPRTVEIHRSRVLEKMGVRSVAELVRLTLSARNPATPRGE